ncbi:MAG: 30S ribosomal protein S18 [Dehalococcoidia bacterium]|nr:30S ribosomal protein S18 [Dehalococcoidia bacterium]
MTSEERPAAQQAERPSNPPGDRPERPERPERPQRPPRRYGPRRKVCRFCVEKMQGVDYKDVGRLRMYISERGKIEPRRKTGTCLKHQRLVATAVKRARHIALLPYTLAHVRETNIYPTRG